MSVKIPILETEAVSKRYYKLRNRFALAALSAMEKQLVGYDPRSYPKEYMDAVTANAFRFADSMLIASGEFKFK